MQELQLLGSTTEQVLACNLNKACISNSFIGKSWILVQVLSHTQIGLSFFFFFFLPQYIFPLGLQRSKCPKQVYSDCFAYSGFKVLPLWILFCTALKFLENNHKSFWSNIPWCSESLQIFQDCLFSFLL